jgi:Zn-dependent protease with chaperone function
MSMVEETNLKKWRAVILFLALDAAQILLVSILTINENEPQMIGYNLSLHNPVVSIVLFIGIAALQLALVYYMVTGMLRGESMHELFPKYDSSVHLASKYSRDQLVQWTTEIAKKSQVTIDRVYLMVSPLPNAFTFHLPFIGSVLVIQSNLLDLLKPGEVQSILAHEIGHIKNRDSLVSIFTRMPAFFVDAIYLYFYVRLALGIATALLVYVDPITAGIRLIVLLAFLGLSRLMTSFAQLLIQDASRKAELLSDYNAAVTMGTEYTMNALIRLGQRIEAVTMLVGEIRWLESLNPERSGPINQAELTRMISEYPLDNIDEENAKTMAPWVFLFTKLKHLRDVYGVALDDKEIVTAIEPAASSLLEKRGADERKTSKKEIPSVIDWRQADLNGDRRLSQDEIVQLVDLLRKNPKKLMFDSEVGQNLLMLDHPDFRSRILFIADNCKL